MQGSLSVLLSDFMCKCCPMGNCVYSNKQLMQCVMCKRKCDLLTIGLARAFRYTIHAGKVVIVVNEVRNDEQHVEYSQYFLGIHFICGDGQGLPGLTEHSPSQMKLNKHVMYVSTCAR